jgi:four helix bundle protein
MKTYKELIVWQKGITLCEHIYTVTRTFPKSEVYGLVSQMQRSAVAIPSNIAEGQRRGHVQEYIQFLRIAYGSKAELETQLYVANKVHYINNILFDTLNTELEEIMKMLNVLIRRLHESASGK